MKTKNLPGFTLVELILVLILSVLVAISCFSFLGFGHQLADQFSESNDKYLELGAFVEAFEKDLFRSTKIEKINKNELIIHGVQEDFAYVFGSESIEKKYIKPERNGIHFYLEAELIDFESGFNSVLQQATATVNVRIKGEDELKLFFEKK